MKLRRAVLLCLLVASSTWAAEAAADLAAVKTILAERAEHAKSAKGSTPTESARWNSDFSNRVCDAALRAYEGHPTDPLRWEAALIALRTLRSFVVEIKPGYDEAIADREMAKIQSLIVRDEAGRMAWNQQMDALETALFAASDVPPAVLAEAYTNAVYRVSIKHGVSPAGRWTEMKPLVEAMEKRVTDPVYLTHAYELAVRLLQYLDPTAYTEFLQARSQSPITEISRWAAGKANVQAAKTTAVEMKFTALDGRAVDLAQFRGKVVLIDFWATWCGPCKEEIPNVLAAYRRFHAEGFEVVAVSLDSEKDRQKLVDYCRDHDLPWPQHFDGKGWQNEFAARYAIRAIPAMFLLDQAGKVVSTEARGPKLGAEIKRLLTLAQSTTSATEVPAANSMPAGTLLIRPTRQPESSAAGGMLGAGALAPEFSSFDLAGKEVRLADYRGKVLILDFWATWCGPCIASMPHTQEVAAKYADQGVAVLAVCTGDKRPKFEDWVKLKASTYPALRFVFDPHEQGTPAYDQRASVALYGVPAIPTQFIIDREGRIVGTTTGYLPGDTSLEQALAAAGVKIDPAALATKARVQPEVLRNGKSTVQVTSQSGSEAKSAHRVPPPPFRETIGKVKAGDVLLDLELCGPNGESRKLSEFRRKPLVLLFTAAEMIPPEFLNGVVEKYGAAGVQALALVTRDTWENYQAWVELHRSRGDRFATAFDPVPATDPRNGVIFRTFQFGAPTPFSIVVDADGKFVGMFPWKVAVVGPQGLAELLRRCGVPVKPEDLPPPSSKR